MFDNFLCEINNKEQLYLIESNKLVKETINWEYNRPVDDIRVQDLIQYIKEHNYVPGIIYLAEIIDKNDNRTIVCYDGNHRREALIKLDNNMRVLCQLLCNTTNGKIIERFKNLNKAVSVSELYLDDINRTKKIKKELEEVVKYFVAKYPKNVSGAKSPNKCNFNKDIFIEKLYKYYKDDKMIVSHEIVTALLVLNEKYKNKKIKIKRISASTRERCDKSGLYLFLKDFTEDL